MESDKLVHSYPASHGCVRAKKQDMDWLVKNLQKGDTVKVYGKW
jgi:lipoprotein-anchoring transpeptidase ErfK/SrfK